MRNLSPREARMVAVLVLISLIAIADIAVVQPLIDGFADRAEERSDLLARYSANDRTIAAIPRLRREAEAQNRLLPRYTLAANDAASADEALRDRMQPVFTTVGGDFRGGEDVAAAPGMADARISGRLSNEQLLAALARLQNAEPYLTITGLEVGADEALVTGKAANLDVQIEAAIPYHATAAR